MMWRLWKTAALSRKCSDRDLAVRHEIQQGLTRARLDPKEVLMVFDDFLVTLPWLAGFDEEERARARDKPPC